MGALPSHGLWEVLEGKRGQGDRVGGGWREHCSGRQEAGMLSPLHHA